MNEDGIQTAVRMQFFPLPCQIFCAAHRDDDDFAMLRCWHVNCEGLCACTYPRAVARPFQIQGESFMPTTRMKSGLLALLLSLLGTAFLMHSLVVHPQEKADKPSASQSKETSSGASSATTTRESGMTAEQSAGASSSKLNDRDTAMFKQIAESHLAEISAGKLAEEKASSNEVKSFAKKMVDDHTKALDDLKQLAQSKGVTLPTEANSQHMAEEKRLRALSGAKFDQQYMQQAGDRAHKDTHRLLQRAASRAEDADLKNYASKAAGTVETHQQMAKETSRNLKSSAEGKSSGGKEASGHGKGKSSGGGSPGSESGASAGGEDKGSGSPGTSK